MFSQGKNHVFASAHMIGSNMYSYWVGQYPVFVLMVPLLVLCIIIKTTFKDKVKSSDPRPDGEQASLSLLLLSPSNESTQYQIQMLNWRIFINKLLTVQVLKMEFRQTCCSLDNVKRFIDNSHSTQQNIIRLSRRRSWSG